MTLITHTAPVAPIMDDRYRIYNGKPEMAVGFLPPKNQIGWVKKVKSGFKFWPTMDRSNQLPTFEARTMKDIKEHVADQLAGQTGEDQLMHDFSRLTTALSPENLSCDGELSYSKANAKKRKLMTEWRALEGKLGRTISEDEVWKWVMEQHKAKAS